MNRFVMAKSKVGRKECRTKNDPSLHGSLTSYGVWPTNGE